MTGIGVSEECWADSEDEKMSTWDGQMQLPWACCWKWNGATGGQQTECHTEFPNSPQQEGCQSFPWSVRVLSQVHTR